MTPRSLRFDRLSLWVALGLGALAALCVVLIDRPAAFWVRDLDPAIRAPFMAIRNVGEGGNWLIPSGVVALITLLLAWRCGKRAWAPFVATIGRAFLFVFVSVAASSIALQIFKVVVGRARPRVLMRDEANGTDLFGFSPFNFDSDFSSLPSGHSNTVFAVALALGYLAPRLRPAFLLLALLFSSARVFAGSHFPGDVLAGAGLAVLTVPLVLRWFAERRLLFAPGDDGRVRRRLTVPLLKRLWRRARRPRTPSIGSPARLRQTPPA